LLLTQLNLLALQVIALLPELRCRLKVITAIFQLLFIAKQLVDVHGGTSLGQCIEFLACRVEMAIGGCHIDVRLGLCHGDLLGCGGQSIDFQSRFVELLLVPLCLSKQGFPQLPTICQRLELQVFGQPHIDGGQIRCGLRQSLIGGVLNRLLRLNMLIGIFLRLPGLFKPRRQSEDAGVQRLGGIDIRMGIRSTCFRFRQLFHGDVMCGFMGGNTCHRCLQCLLIVRLHLFCDGNLLCQAVQL